MANEPKMPVAKAQSASIRIKPQYLNDHKIIFANISRFTHLGSEVILDVGTIDDQAFVKVLQKDQGNDQTSSDIPEIDAFITHRFAFSIQGFLKLKENVDEILAKLIAGGVLEPETKEEK
jgi:hypothetical protein